MKKFYFLTNLLVLMGALARPGLAKDLWVTPVHAEPVQLNATWPVTQYGLARFAFGVPDDMAAFANAHVVFVPTATATGTFSLYFMVKRDGELASPLDIVSQANLPVAFNANQVTEVDVSSIFTGAFDATSAGNDQVSLIVLAQGALIGSARVLGMRFVYDAVPLPASGIADNAVNSAKIANNSITSADVLNESLTGADVSNGSIGTDDIQDGGVKEVDLFIGAVTEDKIRTGAVTGNKIVNGAVTGDKIAGGSLNAAHLADEAGVDFVGGTQSLGLGPVGLTVRSIDVTAPADGFVLLWATGSFELLLDDAEARCGFRTDITPSVPGDAIIAKLDNAPFGSAAGTIPFAVTDAFAVDAGTTTTFRLVCDSPSPTAVLRNSHMTGVFSTTRY
jgi:hypothetical protein